MQAYKLLGKIDSSGRLIVSEAIDLSAGDVEIIVLQSKSIEPSTEIAPTEPKTPMNKPKYRIEALKNLLENAPPLPPDFDPDQAKWEYLKEKHNL